MPIYEYKCEDCNEEFELLVYSSTEVKCPKCESKNLKKKFSPFGMSGVENPFAGQAPSCSSCGQSGSSTCSTCG